MKRNMEIQIKHYTTNLIQLHKAWPVLQLVKVVIQGWDFPLQPLAFSRLNDNLIGTYVKM